MSVGQANPWLTLPDDQDPVTVPASVDAQPVLFRPQPAAGVPLPPEDARLRAIAHQRPAPLWWVGVHGGAGETTLAQLTPASRAAGHAWPIHLDDTPASVILTARTNHAGITAAGHAAQHWAAGAFPAINLLGLVWVPDIPTKLPRTLREHADRIAGGVPRTWTMPWLDTLRETGTVPPDSLPRSLRNTLTDITALTAT